MNVKEKKKELLLFIYSTSAYCVLNEMQNLISQTLIKETPVFQVL